MSGELAETAAAVTSHAVAIENQVGAFQKYVRSTEEFQKRSQAVIAAQDCVIQVQRRQIALLEANLEALRGQLGNLVRAREEARLIAAKRRIA